MHVNVSVTDLNASIDFYNSLFDSNPAVVKHDYARWMLDDPRVNFAITTRGEQKGVDHLGIQVENEVELDEVYARLKTAGAPTLEEGATTCCYAESEKTWIFDPEGIAWETFLTLGESPIYGDDQTMRGKMDSACCTPSQAQDKATSSCCQAATVTAT
jgi:catechol 2,3-dioxygenase-like lactoylglutathione lyase family enzyme